MFAADDFQSMIDSFSSANDYLGKNFDFDIDNHLPDSVDSSSVSGDDSGSGFFPGEDSVSDSGIMPLALDSDDFPNLFSLSFGITSSDSNDWSNSRPRVTFYLPTDGTGTGGYAFNFKSNEAFSEKYQWVRFQFLPKGNTDFLLKPHHSSKIVFNAFVLYLKDSGSYADFDFNSAVLSVKTADGSSLSYPAGSDIAFKYSELYVYHGFSFTIPAQESAVTSVSFFVPISPRISVAAGECQMGTTSSRFFSADDVDESPAGLLSSIIGFLRSILEGISNIYDGVKEFVQLLRDLPAKLIDLLVSALKSLFIPTDEQFAELRSGFTSSISDRLGLLVEIPVYIKDLFQDVINADVSTTIDFPEVRFDISRVIPSCPDFVFGPYDVLIIPSYFQASPVLFILRSGITSVIILAFFSFCVRLLHKIFGDSGDSD